MGGCFSRLPVKAMFEDWHMPECTGAECEEALKDAVMEPHSIMPSSLRSLSSNHKHTFPKHYVTSSQSGDGKFSLHTTWIGELAQNTLLQQGSLWFPHTLMCVLIGSALQLHCLVLQIIIMCFKCTVSFRVLTQHDSLYKAQNTLLSLHQEQRPDSL